MSVDKSEPLISIITVLEDVNMIPLVKKNYENIKYDNKQIIIVDDGDRNNIDKFLDMEDCLYLYLNPEEKENLFKKIREQIRIQVKMILHIQNYVINYLWVLSVIMVVDFQTENICYI